MKQYNKSLFIFRRDLRLNDNTGLIKALQSSSAVIPCFMFNPQQIDNNPYRSDNCLQFMIESLKDLDAQLQNKGSRLYLFYGNPKKIIQQLIDDEQLEAVFLNCDYTPFSIHRDLNIKDVCVAHNIAYQSTHDYLLNEPDRIKKKDGGVYSVYTPFMRRAIELTVDQPMVNRYTNYFNQDISSSKKNIYEQILPTSNPYAVIHGGRKNALKILKKISQYQDYDETRNFPAMNGTTGLSAHNKFGTCSIREVYHAICDQLGVHHNLIRQLYWRDFFVHIGFHHPDVLGNTFHEKYNHIKWSTNKKDFHSWCAGQTGFPIVDAGMRELNTTGFMHNRVRMITASFLVKDLHIDWQWGEKYFAQKLVDYDPLVNNGSWQWVASTGCDVQPYFRIFNPWRQQERFDPDCLYIKKWIPELNALSPKEIHRWNKAPTIRTDNYPRPMVDHATETQKAKEMFKRLNVT